MDYTQNSPEFRLASLPKPYECKVHSNIHFALIVPPSPFVVPYGWEWIHLAPFEGPSLIAALIKGLGFKFTLLDQREVSDPEAIRNQINEFDIIGFATYGDSFNYLKRAIKIVKEVRSDLPVILGGPLVTSAPRLIMENTLADFAVVGEGEVTLTEFMDYFSRNKWAKSVEKIDGLVWKKEKVICNKFRKQIEDLDLIPFQDLSAWKRFHNRTIPELYLSYSRGCIANCTFCFRAFPKFKVKSIKRVYDELSYYKSFQFKMAWWNDLTFITNKDYVHRLMDEAFIAHDFRWTAFTRVIGIDVAVLKSMKDRGLDLVLYGMESVSKAVLNNYRKGITKNNIIEAIYANLEAGVKIGGLFIVGAPNDTQESMQDLINFCNEFKEVTRVKYLSALPGTDDYRQFVKNGKIKSELAHLDWLSQEQSLEEDIDHEGFIKFTDNLSKDELRDVYKKFFLIFIL